MKFFKTASIILQINKKVSVSKLCLCSVFVLFTGELSYIVLSEFERHAFCATNVSCLVPCTFCTKQKTLFNSGPIIR